jgi:SAM-dependent methyltransferase
MRPDEWIKEPVESLLDVGCNVGAWLANCARRFPSAKLAGIEINEPALHTARYNVPKADLRLAGAENIPFPENQFQYVTCLEVIEHLPAILRPSAFQEMRRVLRPGGRLLLTVPHAGWFAWLDSSNLRFRFPALYKRVFRRGRRDLVYASVGRPVEWHQHFSEEELVGIAGDGWQRVASERGGLFLYPLMDCLSWPFYQFGHADHPLRRCLQRIAIWDNRLDFGRASYGILLVLEATKERYPAG